MLAHKNGGALVGRNYRLVQVFVTDYDVNHGKADPEWPNCFFRSSQLMTTQKIVSSFANFADKNKYLPIFTFSLIVESRGHYHYVNVS